MSAVGVIIALMAAATARRLADVIALIAGVMLLLIAGLHLAPEAIGEGGSAAIFLILGAALGVVLEFAVLARRNPSAPSAVRSAALLGVLVLGLHSTLDGAVYSITFWHGHESGLLTSLGLLLHEAPEGMVAMMLALQAGLRPRLAAPIAILASSLTTPMGWAVAQLIDPSAGGVMQSMFAASAGLLLFVGGHLALGGWRGLRRGAGPRA